MKFQTNEATWNQLWHRLLLNLLLHSVMQRTSMWTLAWNGPRRCCPLCCPRPGNILCLHTFDCKVMSVYLGKPVRHIGCTQSLSLRSFPSHAFQTVPVLVWWRPCLVLQGRCSCASSLPLFSSDWQPKSWASFFKCCFTSAETTRLVRDKELRMGTSTYMQLQSSDLRSLALWQQVI